MKAYELVGIVFLVYVGIVVVFESGLGFGQPEFDETFVITTFDEAGQGTDRVLVRNVSDGKMYASVNHWPRAWYRRALANPEVEVTIDGVRGKYTAVPVDEGEHDRVDAANPHGFVFRAVTGFPPRRILRLDPR